MSLPKDPIDRQILSCLQSNERPAASVVGGFEYDMPAKLGRLTVHVCHENGLITVMVSIILPTIPVPAWKCMVAACMARSAKGDGQFHFQESPCRVAYLVSKRIDGARLCQQIHLLFRHAADTLFESIQPCLRPTMARAATAARRPPHPDSGLI